MPISPAYQTIPSSDYDPDSPLTTTLMSAIVDRDDFLRQWIGTYGNATASHAHKGAATDGTAQIAYADITGTPTPGTVIQVARYAFSTFTSDVESTGALSFTPKIAYVQAYSTKTATMFGNSVGTTIGTGASDSHVVYNEDGTGTGAVVPTGSGPAVARVIRSYAGPSYAFVDVNVTSFQKASPGVELTLASGSFLNGTVVLFILGE